jgi:hypothetical protein
MSRVASVIVALLLVFSPILGDACVLRCHHQVACHRAAGAPATTAPCHKSASAPSATVTPIGGTCDELPFSAPALRPIDAGASVRALSVPAAIVANAASVAIPPVSMTAVTLPPGNQTLALRISSIPLRL